jgi:hypothetical protein
VTTNLWPYLRLRRAEQAVVHRAYVDSFLPAVLGPSLPISTAMARFEGRQAQAQMVLRYGPLPPRLRCGLISMRSYLATRAWAAIEHGSAPDGMLVDDARPVGNGELWSISLRTHGGGGVARSVHILAATCEIVGAAAGAAPSDARPLRADWARFLAHGDAQTPLLARLAWAHRAEYERGVSTLWRARAAREGPVGAEKLMIAERYVLAHVVDSG